MNYLAQCFNFEQIANLKNHDGIKKKNNHLGGNGGNRTGQNVGAGGASASAISGFSTDRRPIKMRDFGMLKG